MAQQRARAAGADDGLGRLAEILEGMATRDQPIRRFKAPEYDGMSDIELFIQLTDVARANQWDEGAALLHLRRSLTGKSTE